jgi:hypothetical protein
MRRAEPSAVPSSQALKVHVVTPRTPGKLGGRQSLARRSAGTTGPCDVDKPSCEGAALQSRPSASAPCRPRGGDPRLRAARQPYNVHFPPPGEHSLEGTRRLEAKPKPPGREVTNRDGGATRQGAHRSGDLRQDRRFSRGIKENVTGRDLHFIRTRDPCTLRLVQKHTCSLDVERDHTLTHLNNPLYARRGVSRTPHNACLRMLSFAIARGTECASPKPHGPAGVEAPPDRGRRQGAAGAACDARPSRNGCHDRSRLDTLRPA